MEYRTMMKLVIGTEGVFFLSLIMTYVYMGYRSGYAREELELLHLPSAAAFTLVLLCSSFTFWAAEQSQRKGKYDRMKILLLSTCVLGLVFLIGQTREYLHLLNKHLTLSSSPFGSSFYTLTGFHALHVMIGLLIFLIILWMLHRNRSKALDLSVAGMYWHFVDVVWLFVFTVVYVLPRFTTF